MLEWTQPNENVFTCDLLSDYVCLGLSGFLKKKKKIGFRLPTSMFSVNPYFTLIVIRAEKEVRYKPVCLLLVRWFDVGEVSTFEIVFGSYQKTLIFGKLLTYYLSDGWRRFSSIFEVCL